MGTLPEADDRDTQPAMPPTEEDDDPPPVVIPRKGAELAVAFALARVARALAELEEVALACARGLDAEAPR
jgi:hypothetical protein